MKIIVRCCTCDYTCTYNDMEDFKNWIDRYNDMEDFKEESIHNMFLIFFEKEKDVDDSALF